MDTAADKERPTPPRGGSPSGEDNAPGASNEAVTREDGEHAMSRAPRNEHERPETPRHDQRNMTGGAVLPNNAQELAGDSVEESDLESFPASDAPSWWIARREGDGG